MSDYRQNDTLPEENENVVVSEKAEPTAEPPAPPAKASIAASLLDTLEMFVFALCAVILVLISVFRLCTVTGPSMENSFYEGEKLLVTDLFYTPERGDVIVFHQTGALNEPIIKRVIATEGETVSILYEKDKMIVEITKLDGSVIVLEEDEYVNYNGNRFYLSDTVTVPEGHVFVMGDNRTVSKDSRDVQIGCVDERRILGKVIFRLTPFSRMGTVS